MSDREIRVGIRALLATGDKTQVPRDQRLALLSLLADGLNYVVTGIDRRFADWNPDGPGEYRYHTNFNFISGIFHSLDAVDRRLDFYNLPRLDTWSHMGYDDNDNGMYTTTILEHHNAEDYSVTYTLQISVDVSVPLLPRE